MPQTLDYVTPAPPDVDRRAARTLLRIAIAHGVACAIWALLCAGWWRWRIGIVQADGSVWPLVRWAALLPSLQAILVVGGLAGLAMFRPWMRGQLRTRWLGACAIACAALPAARLVATVYVF